MTSIDGIAAALAGDRVSCPACRSEGVIGPDGPRLFHTFDGREYALDDDLCLCKCTPPPRLLSVQTFECQQVDDEWHADQSAAAAVLAAQFNTTTHDADDDETVAILLRAPDTGELLQHRPYRLQLKQGAIEGMTDADGATRPLSAAERVSMLAWHVGSDEKTA